MNKKGKIIREVFVMFSMFVVLSINANAQDNKNLKIENILSHLSIEEKVSLCSGGKISGDRPCFKGIERLGIPNVREVDGPRGASVGSSNTTAFPAGVLLGATWNPTIIEQAGKVMGEESRALGYSVLLAPALNILRDPLDGRFFEYYTEDPYLNGAVAVGLVKGVQSEGVAACAKHYVCNNRERNRNYYMSVIDDRTLHEIYLPGFKSVVEEGNVYTVMTSANGVNYEYVSDSRKLLTDVLKNKWGFKGFVLTDWLQTRSVEKAAFAGLDVSMPGGDNCGFGDALLKAVKTGRVPISIIDDKVRRILGVYDKIGALDNIDIHQGASVNTIAHQNVAKKVAEEGIVLLKNSDKTLPLKEKQIKKILVTGPNANKRFCIIGLGGSSWVQSPYEVTVLKGIKNVIGEAKVEYISSDDLGGYNLIPSDNIAKVDGVPGIKAEYYIKGKSTPVITRIEKNIDFMWEMKTPDSSIPVDKFREVRFQAIVNPPVDGKYTFRFIYGGGSVRVYTEGFAGAPIAISSPSDKGITTASVDLKHGESYHLNVVYVKGSGDSAIRLEWSTPNSEVSRKKMQELTKAARQSDAVVYVGGIDHSIDTEGRDRLSLDFPNDQTRIINMLSKINKKVNVVLINGSPLEIGQWLPNVKSLIEAWYPGMEGGNAVANILFGKTNPSGRLPFTWPKKLSDSPCYKLGFQDNNNVLYTDKLMVGYRYFDTKEVEPQFPFGYGLSYSTFSYNNLQLAKEGFDVIKGKVEVKNLSNVDGYETIQIYVKPINPSVDRPIHELKAFKKVFVKAGETVTVDFSLNKKDAFSYYDVHIGDWKIDPGKYEIEIGNNSENILTQALINI